MRSPLLNEKIGQTLFIGFLWLYFLISFLGLGIMGGKLLENQYPTNNITELGLAFITYAFIYSFFLRMMMQTFPYLHITPYLILPISKSKIANHLLNRSLFSYFNVLPLVLMISVVLIYIRPEVSNTQLYIVMVFIIGFIRLNHFLTFLQSKAAVFNKNWIFLIFLVLGGLIWLDYKDYIQLIEILVGVSQQLITNPFMGFVPLALCFVIITSLRKDLIGQYQLSVESGNASETARKYHFAWFDLFGVIGALFDLGFRLILRSKRAKSYLYMSGIMITYPLLLLSIPETNPEGLLVVMALFVSGTFSLNYGLLLLSWNSLHFNLLLSRVVSYEDIFKAKFYLLAASALFSTLLSFPFVFWSAKFYLYVVCLSFFSMSIVPAIYMFITNYKSIKIDPHTGGAFSFNGFGAAHWLAMIPIALITALLFYIGDQIAGEWLGLLNLSGIGILGLIYHKSMVKWNTGIFHSQKYTLSESFKKQE